MELSIAHNFLILTFHPKRSGYRITMHARDAGIVGGIVLDLVLQEHIRIKDGYAEIKSKSGSKSVAHRLVWERIRAGGKPGKVKRVIRHFAQKGRKLRYALLEDLRDAGMISLEDKRFLFIPYRRAHLLRSDIQDKMAHSLRESLLKERELDTESVSLLSLISACKMHRVISTDSTDRKLIRKKLKKVLADVPVAAEVHDVIREAQAAVIAATSAAATTSAASAGS